MPRRPQAEGKGAAPVARALPSRNGPTRAVVETLSRVIEVDSNLLLLGESGVGKDHVARIVHKAGPRRDGPFVPIDCASIPTDLFESELFGYEKGAFTDAREPRQGKLEQAQGGVVYLDEVGALPMVLQAKLLRMIDEKSFTRLGGGEARELDIRIISSSNLELGPAVDAGRFRADLFYRLNVVSVTIPTLRERSEDLMALARQAMRDACKRHDKKIEGIEAETADILKGYTWPGNIRELRSVIERAVLTEESSTLTVRSLPIEVFGRGEVLTALAVRRGWTLEQLEIAFLRATILDCGGNYSKAARRLGISRKALLEKRRRFGIDDEMHGKTSPDEE